MLRFLESKKSFDDRADDQDEQTPSEPGYGPTFGIITVTFVERLEDEYRAYQSKQAGDSVHELYSVAVVLPDHVIGFCDALFAVLGVKQAGE